ncbi:MAG: hypothetical protein JXQ73_24655 [Phycisphaerae bacterium]|nr:hypothetical protein [Phycisphaerae bacterium]
MRRGMELMILGLITVLTMGASCRQETTQSVIASFLNQLAVTLADALAAVLVGPLAQ